MMNIGEEVNNKTQNKITISDQKIIYINNKNNQISRTYNLHTMMEFTRRGHYRKLRNGEIKWIEPKVIKRGEGEKLSKKYMLIQ